jgi:hypothetical protein
MRHYDVLQHHPHPPGFPLYIAAGRLVGLTGLDAFHSLQGVNFLASIAIVPAMFFMARELRAGVASALSAAMFLAFFPNVWFYGGTAFSDVPSMVLVTLAVGLMMRGCRDPWAFLAGAAVAAVSAGFRPQNLAIVFVPMALATWFSLRRRKFVPPVAAVLILLVIVGTSYFVAVTLSGGWASYREAVHQHQLYITQVDSYRSPTRPPLINLVDDFFVRPYHAPVVNTIISVLAFLSVVSLVRRRLPVWLGLASFGPLCILAWLLLDRFSVSRFSIGYAPLLALLAAEGTMALTRQREAIGAAIAAVVTAVMIVWAWPAIEEAHTHESPPAEATRWIHENVDPARSTLYVHEGMLPFSEAMLGEYDYRQLPDSVSPSVWTAMRPGVKVKEGASFAANAHVFARAHGRLFDIARQRYFEVTVIPMKDVVDFVEGWYPEEFSGSRGWRWMGHRSRTLLVRLNGHARLVLRLYVPLDALPSQPVLTVRLNGSVVDRFVAATSNIEKSWDVEARGDASNELTLETDRIVNPAAKGLRPDARDLGIRLEALEWLQRP